MPHYKTNTARRELIDWSPYIRLIHDYPEVGSRGTHMISHPNIGDHAFHYFYSGSGKYQLNDNIYEIEPGCLFIVRPGSPFSFTVNPISCPHMLNIHFDLKEQYDSFYPHPYPPNKRQSSPELLAESVPDKVIIKNRKAYESIFFELYSIFLLNENSWELKKKCLMLELIALVFDNCEDCQTEHHAAVKKALNFIYNNLNKKITLNEIVNSSGVCRSLLINLFKQECGLSPVRFAYKAKIEKAKNILSSNGMPIKEVADILGFADVYHFSRIFKEVSGMPPAAYRSSTFRPTDK